MCTPISVAARSSTSPAQLQRGETTAQLSLATACLNLQWTHDSKDGMILSHTTPGYQKHMSLGLCILSLLLRA